MAHWFVKTKNTNKIAGLVIYLIPMSLFGSIKGIQDLSHLSAAIKSHEPFKNHVEVFLTLAGFGHERIDTASNTKKLADFYITRKIPRQIELL